MNFQPAAWQMRRARQVLEDWNQANPNRQIAFEWVEEMLLAWRQWKEWVYDAPQEALKHHERYQEYACKLPERLVRDIFPQV